jgi:hypothetical protein
MLKLIQHPDADKRVFILQVETEVSNRELIINVEPDKLLELLVVRLEALRVKANKAIDSEIDRIKGLNKSQ